ncbi:uncharacterized protein B0H64DRAFT_96094 [Chaetomium fimeti]|uniref:Uncharacterized protein n=1 Tax=Chaetomium fimeti TaxID=1854472 RepID=A0AAE0LVV7_9PEZI|nr:hypothetical protein B0H64DRAFT_96094 [Chaetomium fimeti]
MAALHLDNCSSCAQRGKTVTLRGGILAALSPVLLGLFLHAVVTWFGPLPKVEGSELAEMERRSASDGVLHEGREKQRSHAPTCGLSVSGRVVGLPCALPVILPGFHRSFVSTSVGLLMTRIVGPCLSFGLFFLPLYFQI